MKRSRLSEDEARYLQLLKRRRAAADARDDLIVFARFMKPDPDRPDDTDASLYHVARRSPPRWSGSKRARSSG